MITGKTAIKWLTDERRTFIAAVRKSDSKGYLWPEPGVWTQNRRDIRICGWGWHYSHAEDSWQYYHQHPWLVELENPIYSDEHMKGVATRARLGAKVPWDNDLQPRRLLIAMAKRHLPSGRSDLLAEINEVESVVEARKWGSNTELWARLRKRVDRSKSDWLCGPLLVAMLGYVPNDSVNCAYDWLADLGVKRKDNDNWIKSSTVRLLNGEELIPQ